MIAGRTATPYPLIPKNCKYYWNVNKVAILDKLKQHLHLKHQLRIIHPHLFREQLEKSC